MNLFQKQLILGNGKSMAELPYAHRFGPPLPPLRISIEDFEGAKMSTTTQPTEDRCEFVFRSNSGRLTICGLSASEHDPLYVRHKFFSQLSAPQETPAQHSPLPWKIVDRRRAPLPNIVIMSGEEIVADIEGVHMRDRMLRWKPEDADAADAHARANADLIVKCVNRDPAFQKLVKVARQVEAWLTIRKDLTGRLQAAGDTRIASISSREIEILDKLREALRLVREGEK